MTPCARSLLARLDGLRHIADIAAGELFQFQQIGSQHIGAGQCTMFQKIGDAGCHYAPLVGVTHHGVTKIEGGRIERLEPGHSSQDLLPLFGRAEVAAQQRIALGQHADLRQAVYQLTDMTAGHHHPLPAFAVLGVVGELHRVHRPHLDPEATHGKNGGAVAGTAKDYVGLNGEHSLHDW